MKVVKIGEGKKVIVLLHGGGLSWWNYKSVAELLSKDFTVCLPILDGHGGSDREFTSIEENAAEIIRYIDEEFLGEIELLGGLSLGGQIAAEIISQRPNICKAVILESVCTRPSRITNMLVKPMMDSSFFLIKYRWFAKLQFSALKIDNSLFENYYEDTCKITKGSMINFLLANTAYSLKESIKDTKARVKVLVGAKEQGNMISSAKEISASLDGCELCILDGLYHGEFSIKHPEKYVKCVKKLLE